MTVLEVKHLSKSFGGLDVLKDISFDVKMGEVIAIIGPSGSGKSTLLRCINQLEKISGGRINVCGMEMIEKYKNGKPVYASAQELRSIRLKIGLVFQNFNLFPHMSVMQNVIEAPVCVLKKNKEEAKANAVSLLKKMGLEDKAKQRPQTLSGGEMRKCAIAGILAMEPDVIFMDEPFANLDYPSTLTVIASLITLHEKGYTLLVVSHEAEKFLAHTDTLFIMEGGKLKEEGNSETLFSRLSDYDVYLPSGASFGDLTWLKH